MFVRLAICSDALFFLVFGGYQHEETKKYPEENTKKASKDILLL